LSLTLAKKLKEVNVTKASGLVKVLLVAGSLLAFNGWGGAVPPQAAKPAAGKVVPAAKLTSQQAESLNLAWRNLARAYQDLMTAAPDVKGDTTKLEGALKAAIHDLHELDPGLAEASGLQGQDKGKTREYVFNAVQQHLDLAKKYIEDSGVKSPNAVHALGQIMIAYGELRADRTAPVK
jgi:hypothetical protein